MNVRRREREETANGTWVVDIERSEIAWDTPRASLMKMPCHAAQRMACISQLHLKLETYSVLQKHLERISAP